MSVSARWLLVFVVGCDEGSSPDAAYETDADPDAVDVLDVDCEAEPIVTYDTFGRGFLATYCDACHGPEVADRKGAPPAATFDDPDVVSDFADRILLRAADDEGVAPMPPAGGVTPDDLDRLRIWLTCYP